jgi:hypothetical protein
MNGQEQFGAGYIPTEYKNGLIIIDEADYDLIIANVEDGYSQKGNLQRVVTVKVPGHEGLEINTYLVHGEYFNQNMTKFFDTFGIQYGNFNPSAWIGKRGRGHLWQEPYTKKDGTEGKSMKIKYLIPPTKPQMPGQPQAVRQQQYPSNAIPQFGQQKPAQTQYRPAEATDQKFEDDIPF